MAKKKTLTFYKCAECGYSQPAWLGRCPKCGAWNSLEEVTADVSAFAQGRAESAIEKAKPVPLSQVNADFGERLITGIDEFDRVLGGGAMKRSAILLGGEPGIGKSTLMIQSASLISRKLREAGAGVLYVSGEESAAQIKSRADRLRLDCEGIQILCAMRLEDIRDALCALNPAFVIVDSIQTVYSAEAGIVPGTINQLKYCANELISYAKGKDSILIMSAHITKDGAIAGPKSLEHMVDTVISFERTNDEVRFLRALKNRFGSVDELGIFSMTEKGLEGIADPSTMFITKRAAPVPPGIAATCVFEGTRSFLVEIQALTVPAKASLSRIYSERIESARVARIAAVIEKRAGLKFSEQDIYVNVAGGVRLSESSADAAIAAALYSARTDIPTGENTVILGELSLAGEIRPVTRLKQRIKTSKDLGFDRIFSPEPESSCTQISSISEMIKSVFSPAD